MDIISIKIRNFRSIGEEKNEIIFHGNLISLVGKNEAGKTNIIKALSKIEKPILEYIKNDETIRFENGDKNRINPEMSPSINIKYRINNDDIYFIKNQVLAKQDKFSLDSNEFNIEIVDGESILYSSFINKVIESSSDWDKYYEDFNNNNFKTNQSSQTISKIDSINNKIDFVTAFKSLRIDSNKLNKQSQTTYSQIIDYLEKFFFDLSTILPKFVNVKLASSRESYTYKEFIDAIKDKNSFVFKLFKYIDFDYNELVPIFRTGKTTITMKSYIEASKRIEDTVENFNKKSGIDNIKLLLDIEKDRATFFVDGYTSYSERSDGFKQAFNLFLSTDSRDKEDQKYVFLVDEPDRSLHISAQKELLKLFKNITKSKDYVIYATHSPFMIASEDVSAVKLVQKINSCTTISKDMTSESEKNLSKMETLTPVLHAIGYRLSDNIGPNYKKLNIVVEGKWDKIYLETMLDYFDIQGDNRPCVIASVGASNIPNIAKILFSWGIKMAILLDNDKRGRYTYKSLLKARLNDFATYVIECSNTTSCKGGCCCDFEIEDVIYENYNKQYNQIKEEAALDFSRKFEADRNSVGTYSEESFRKIFSELGVKFNK